MGQYIGMDNLEIKVVGAWLPNHAEDDLGPVLQIALNHHRTCTAWAVRDGALFLFWHHRDIKDAQLLLTPINTVQRLHALVIDWLGANPPKDEIPGSDADEVANGFEAWTDRWGHGGGDHAAMVAIKPRTRWLGK